MFKFVDSASFPILCLVVSIAAFVLLCATINIPSSFMDELI